MTKNINEKIQHIMDINNQRADLNLTKFKTKEDRELFEVLENARNKRFKNKYNEIVGEILNSKKE